MDTSHSDQLHRLADTTYKNTEELIVDLKSLVAAAKVYQRAMEGVVQAAGQFYFQLDSIGAKAANLPGAVRKLGDSMVEMAEGHKDIASHQADWIESLNTDFIVPLEMKLNTEAKNASTAHKAYKQEQSKRKEAVEKTSSKVSSIQKKKNPTREHVEKFTQLQQVLTDSTEELHSTCTEGLRKALIEERKLYCFVVDHFCSVIHNQIAYNSTSHQVLSSQVVTWSTLCSSPNELPPESMILLTDPRSSRAFPAPMNQNEPTFTGSGMGQPITPPPTQTQPAQRTRRPSCRVKALYPHATSAQGQLEFTSGDLIDAIDDPQEGWQFGENITTGKSGWFPVQFVDQIWPPPQPRGQRNSPMPTRSVGIPPTIPERDYSGGQPATAGASEPAAAGDQQGEQNQPTAPS